MSYIHYITVTTLDVEVVNLLLVFSLDGLLLYWCYDDEEEPQYIIMVIMGCIDTFPYCDEK